ncbi:hypothetical protein [Methylocaldum sp.]|uniref:hypothetical protein n=1 Tax=Methylocaldum sp. TaxID=1969727 RepID=UPI002D6C7FCD|nr:hypothetical protein [Methylocaldum sp.]HYE35327.1 hypothetical protein [Methylocaldum sp.]
MRLFSRVLIVGALLSALQPAFGDDEWQGTTLSDQTLEKVKLALVAYQGCVNNETRTHIGDQLDSRAITDRILKTCEEKLSKVKAAFDGEKVPGTISERYMRSRRTQAARQILRTVMGAQAAPAATGQP